SDAPNDARRLELGSQQRIGSITVSEPGPQRELVPDAPTRSSIAARIERLARGRRKLRRIPRTDFGTRVQSPEVRDVTMVAINFLIFLEPLQNPSIRSDTSRRQPLQFLRDLSRQRAVNTQNSSGLDARAEQLSE